MGFWTVGVGHKMSEPLSLNACGVIFAEDLQASEIDCRQLFSAVWESFPDHVKEACINMMFNLGPTKMAGFLRMIACLRGGDYEGAADQAIISRWATQTGDRASRVADLMRGKDGY